MRVLAIVLLFIALTLGVAQEEGAWTCIETKASQPLTPSASVGWSAMNCTNTINPPLLHVNSLVIDLTAKDVRIVPGVSTDAANPLMTVPNMAASNTDRNFIAGINGGYFWRTDISGTWIDDVCRGKTRKEAELPAEVGKPNQGIHDGAVVIDGKVVGSDCDCWGFSRPALASNSDASSETGWSIDVLQRGEQGSPSVVSGLAAGPNLVSYSKNADGSFTSYVDIPSDDDNININEHAANTGFGLIFDASGKAVKMIMVTTDGSDECGRLDQTCGINAKHLAQLMIDHFAVHQAMSMDQGGSTTMWVKGAPSMDGDGVVSYAGGGARNVANAMFVELVNA